MSDRYRCINNCGATFRTLVGRKVHELDCFSHNSFSSTTSNLLATSASLITVNLSTSQSSSFIDNIEVNLDDELNQEEENVGFENNFSDEGVFDVYDNEFEEECDFDKSKSSNNNAFNMEDNFIKLLNKLKEINTELPPNVFHNLYLFYTNHITLSACDEMVEQDQNISSKGIKVYVPRMFQSLHRQNPVAAAHKKILCYCNKSITLINESIIKAGPFLHKNESVTCDALLSFRPLAYLLLSFLYDDEMNSIGTYVSKPIEQNADWFCATYSQSRNFKTQYSYLEKHFDKGFIPFPLLLWCDGASYIRWNKNGSAHTVMLIPLPYSVMQLNQYTRGCKVWALNLQYSLDKDIASGVASYLRTACKSKYMSQLLHQLNELTTTGLATKKGLIVPYLACMSCDLVEMRSLTATSHCGICNQKEEPKNISKEFDEYLGYGMELESDVKEKVMEFHNFQTSCLEKTLDMNEKAKINDYTKTMNAYYQENGRKMIPTMLDHIKFPSFMKDYRPCIYVDRLHSVVLNEVKFFMQHLFQTINPRCLQMLERESANFKYFPTGFICSEISNLTGAQIARGAIMIICLFFDHKIPMAYSTNAQMKQQMNILDNLCLLTAISAKEMISKKGEEGNMSDLEILKCVIGELRKTKYFAESKRDNVHLLLSHFCDLSMWFEYGSPRYFSSSIGESTLARVKQSIQSCNKRSEWRSDILRRISLADVYLPTTSQDSTFDWLLEPDYLKVAMYNGKVLEIGFIDRNRGNQYNKSRSVTFQIYETNVSHYCVAAKSFNKRMLVDEILVANSTEKNSYHDINNIQVTFKGRLNGMSPRLLEDVFIEK